MYGLFAKGACYNVFGFAEREGCSVDCGMSDIGYNDVVGSIYADCNSTRSADVCQLQVDELSLVDSDIVNVDLSFRRR